jgi:hypothetical protein
MLAVQWHPECLRTDHSAALFDWVATAAATRLTRVDVHLLVEPQSEPSKGIAAAS